MTKNPTTNPIAGEVTIGTSTFQRMPLPSHQCCLPASLQTITDQWPCAAARLPPQSPPTNACVELEGKPTHHVTRFQTIAPSNAQTMISDVTTFESTSPVEIVWATAVPTSAP